LNPALAKLLWLSVLLSALALWWPSGQPPALVGAQHVVSAANPAPLSLGSNVGSVEVSWQLPAALPVVTLAPARFDPFVGVLPPAPPAVKPLPVVQQVLPAAPPAPIVPQAPAMTYRFLGRMVDPSGRPWVYLAKGDVTVPVAPGTRLDEGFVVTAVDAQGIHLHYPPADLHMLIPVPPPPKEPNAR
jgi:hypothetical protein